MPLENSKFEVLRNADSISFVFSSTYDNIDEVCDRVTQFLKSLIQNIEKQLFSINLVIREGLTNAIRHGNKGDPEKTVKCLMTIENFKLIKIVIEDQGEGFDWRKQRTTTIKEDEEHGRGVSIMETYFSDCSYNEKGNILYLEKDISNC